MRHVWTAALGVLSVVAAVCVLTVGADLLQVGSFSRRLFGDYVEVFARGRLPAGSVAEGAARAPPATQAVMEGEGAVDLVIPEWMVRQRESVRVRFPGGRVQQLPFFTRVASGIYMLEFSGPSYKPVLCQVQVQPRGRARVIFDGQSCRVELND